MKVNFFGTGSGFTSSHTNAYFFKDKNIVLIDLSMQHVEKAVNLVKKTKPEDVYLILTHMHPDHVSGIVMFAQHLFYTMGMNLKIIVPNELYKDIIKILEIEGAERSMCYVIPIHRDKETAIRMPLSVREKYKIFISSWLLDIIDTDHAPELYGKCFGYRFCIDDSYIIYTGDTCSLENFMPYIKWKNCSHTEFYVDCSLHYGKVHLKWENIKDQLKNMADSGIKVYLMHMDDEEEMKKQDLGNICMAQTSDTFIK